MNGHGRITWRTIVQYVDIDTGFFLTKKEAETHYKTLKKTKEYESNKNCTRRTTTITWLCRKLDRIQSTIW